jgi:hypothetical protein
MGVFWVSVAKPSGYASAGSLQPEPTIIAALARGIADHPNLFGSGEMKAELGRNLQHENRSVGSRKPLSDPLKTAVENLTSADIGIPQKSVFHLGNRPHLTPQRVIPRLINFGCAAASRKVSRQPMIWRAFGGAKT